jgi:hypothetical protein
VVPLAWLVWPGLAEKWLHVRPVVLDHTNNGIIHIIDNPRGILAARWSYSQFALYCDQALPMVDLYLLGMW